MGELEFFILSIVFEHYHRLSVFESPNLGMAVNRCPPEFTRDELIDTLSDLFLLRRSDGLLQPQEQSKSALRPDARRNRRWILRRLGHRVRPDATRWRALGENGAVRLEVSSQRIRNRIRSRKSGNDRGFPGVVEVGFAWIGEVERCPSLEGHVLEVLS